MSTEHEEIALAVRAATADALARGEQIFVLMPGGPRRLPELEHEQFWIHPLWEGGDPRDLTEPYQDRLRALQDLRHDDGGARLRYYATAEYLDAAAPAELRSLDGEHTLSSGGVRSLFGRSPEDEVTLLVLRVYERREAVMVPDGESARSEDGRWVRLPEPLPIGRMAPVLPDGRFVSEKAKLLQRTGTMRAV